MLGDVTTSGATFGYAQALALSYNAAPDSNGFSPG